jgi:hypothetical protein
MDRNSDRSFGSIFLAVLVCVSVIAFPAWAIGRSATTCPTVEVVND